MEKKPIFDLSGRVAVVTGASSGLGLQMSKGFALQGADLVIMARRIERLEKVLEKYKNLKYGFTFLTIGTLIGGLCWFFLL